MRTAEQIIADIDKIDAVLDANRKDTAILYQERRALFDELVALNRHELTKPTTKID